MGLAFGVCPDDEDGRSERIEAICRSLGLEDEVMRLLGSKRAVAWGDVLSQTQKYLLSLARALIANPEILCIHKPTLVFNEDTSGKVLRMLKKFVRGKGIEQDPGTR